MTMRNIFIVSKIEIYEFVNDIFTELSCRRVAGGNNEARVSPLFCLAVSNLDNKQF